MTATPPRRAQSTAVKRALRDAGIPVESVRFGTGTASYWVRVELAHGSPSDVQHRAKAIAVTTLGRRPDVIDASGERDHNECVNVVNARAPEAP